jgi:hypothetical protein
MYNLPGSPPVLPPIRPVQYVIENLVFKERQVHLDGYHFKNCAFISCELLTSNGNFVLEKCFLGNVNRIMFNGSAPRIARLASLLNWETSPELRAIHHPDGSVTIK